MKRIFIAIFFLLLAHSDAALAQAKIVVSIHPIQMIVPEIAGDEATVGSIIPSGADPHFFDIKPSVQKEIVEADGVIFNGLGLEHWNGAPQHSDKKVLLLSSLLGETPPDEHTWLNPHLVSLQVTGVAEFLCGIRSQGCDRFRNNAKNLKVKLEEFLTLATEQSRALKNPNFVSIHPAWSQFASAVGLKVVGHLRETESRFVGTKDYAEIVKLIGSRGIKTLVADPSTSLSDRRMFSEDYGIRVIVLDEMGGNSRDILSFYSSSLKQLMDSLNS